VKLFSQLFFLIFINIFLNQPLANGYVAHGTYAYGIRPLAYAHGMMAYGQ